MKKQILIKFSDSTILKDRAFEADDAIVQELMSEANLVGITRILNKYKAKIKHLPKGSFETDKIIYKLDLSYEVENYIAKGVDFFGLLRVAA